MKLTKGKISKLYNKHRQSCRRKKICKRRKNNQSFRRMKPLNLATKTLKMKGGAVSLIGEAFTRGLSKKGRNDIMANFSLWKLNPFAVLIDMKTLTKYLFLASYSKEYQVEQWMKSTVADTKRFLQTLKFTDIAFEEFNSEEMYLRITLAMFQFMTTYTERYKEVKMIAESREKDNELLNRENNDKKMFGDLYGVPKYADYCKTIDDYVNNPKIDEIYNYFNDQLIINAPKLNQGFVTICKNNLFQLINILIKFNQI